MITETNIQVKFIYSDSESFLEQNKRITTRFVEKTEKSKERYRTDVDGRGKSLDHPIIYLGLKRLVPLATESKITPLETSFTKNNVTTYSNLIKEIFVSINQK